MAYSNTGSVVYFSPTPRPVPLTKAEFEAIVDWEDVGCTGEVGEIGTSAEFNEYNCWKGGVIKLRQPYNPGEVTFEFMWDYTNEGQVGMRDASDTNFYYAMKIEYSNAPDEDTTGTVVYMRGQVAGWVIPNGAAEDGQLRQATFALAEKHIEVDPQPIAP